MARPSLKQKAEEVPEIVLESNSLISIPLPDIPAGKPGTLHVWIASEGGDICHPHLQWFLRTNGSGTWPTSFKPAIHPDRREMLLPWIHGHVWVVVDDAAGTRLAQIRVTVI